MARRRKKRKITARNRMFGRVAKACHKTTNSASAYGKCMSAGMSTGTKRRKKGAKKITCKGLKKSGSGKGRLKKGYTWKGAKKGACPRRV